MKKLERGERRLALFFLVAGVLLTIGVITAFVGLPFGDDQVEFHLQFTDSIIGIDVGSPVRYKGVRFGSIRRITVDPSNEECITVTLAVDPHTPITESTAARIASATFLGPYYIELAGTRPDSPRLAPGGYIPADPSTLSKILKGSESLVANIDSLVTQLSDFLSTERQDRLWATIDNVNDTLERAAEDFSSVSRSASDTLAAIEDLSARSAAILAKREQAILNLIDNTRSISERLDTLLKSGRIEELADKTSRFLTTAEAELAKDSKFLREWLDENQVRPPLEAAVAELAKMRESFTRLSEVAQGELTRMGENDIGPLAAELRATGATLDALLRMLRRNPRALLFGEKPDEIRIPEPNK